MVLRLRVLSGFRLTSATVLSESGIDPEVFRHDAGEIMADQQAIITPTKIFLIIIHDSRLPPATV